MRRAREGVPVEAAGIDPLPENQVKLVVWDLDDTLIYGEDCPSVGEHPVKFTPVGPVTEGGPGRVVDGPNRVQVLVPNARRVLEALKRLGATQTFASMGPEWQMRRFMEAFRLDHYFDWEIGSYDRRDKGEKVELVIEHYNGRLLASRPAGDPGVAALLAKPTEVVFVDDNLGYLARVDAHIPGVKVVWAHYRGEDGLLELFRDLEEQHGVRLDAALTPSSGRSL
ncbi:MAG: HAD family hydrolase [Promethearchaeota archaeon]